MIRKTYFHHVIKLSLILCYLYRNDFFEKVMTNWATLVPKQHVSLQTKYFHLHPKEVE